MLNRRTVITFQTLERTFYRLPNSETVEAICDRCKETVNWLTPSQACALTGSGLRELFRILETNALHFIETEPGSLHICSNSLESYLK